MNRPNSKAEYIEGWVEHQLDSLPRLELIAVRQDTERALLLTKTITDSTNQLIAMAAAELYPDITIITLSNFNNYVFNESNRVILADLLVKGFELVHHNGCIKRYVPDSESYELVKLA